MNRDDLIECLKKQKIVANDTVVATKLAAVAKTVSISQNTRFITQGAATRDVFFILQGKASVEIKGHHQAYRSHGDHVGEMAAIDLQHRRAASVIAVEPTKAAKVSAKDFNVIARDHPFIYQYIAIEQGNRLRQRSDRIPLRNDIPQVFIGSSSERRDVLNCVVKSIKALGAAKVKTVAWDKDVFEVSAGTLDDLEDKIKRADFTILILSGDDTVQRGRKKGKIKKPRDNCIFELGLGLGVLGRKRTMILKPTDDGSALPSDLNGVTYKGFALKPKKPEAALQKRINAACKEFKERILAMGSK